MIITGIPSIKNIVNSKAVCIVIRYFATHLPWNPPAGFSPASGFLMRSALARQRVYIPPVYYLPPLAGGGAAFSSITAFEVLSFATHQRFLHTLRVSIPEAWFQPLPLGRKQRFAYAAARLLIAHCSLLIVNC
jgi:hypothetical protein